MIVGPNNSGKSALLKDIENYFNMRHPSFQILDKLGISISQNVDEYEKFEDDILEFEDGERIKNNDIETIPLVKKHLFSDSHDSPRWYSLETIKKEFDNKNVEYFRQNFLKYFVLRLDGNNRFKLVNPKSFGIFRTSKLPHNYLSRLYLNKEDQKKLQKTVFENFGW